MSEYVRTFFRMLILLCSLSVIFTMMYSIKLFTSSTYFKVNKVAISGLKMLLKKMCLM